MSNNVAKSVYIDGRHTEANLCKLADYASQNSQVNANKTNQEPWRENVNPDGVRHLDGSTDKASWSKGDPSQHKFFKGSGGSDSGVGRAELARAQGRKRRA